MRVPVSWLAELVDLPAGLSTEELDAAFVRIGFEVEGRPFRPHLTIARVKHPMPDELARQLWRQAKRTDYRTDVIIRSIDLMRSDLSADGPAY